MDQPLTVILTDASVSGMVLRTKTPSSSPLSRIPSWPWPCMTLLNTGTIQGISHLLGILGQTAPRR
jgi:hypothetical protein